MPHRVLMLLSNEYRPDPRVQKEAQALIEAGHDVTVLAWDRDHKFDPSSIEGGVKLRRVRTRRFQGKSGLMRNYPVFACRMFRTGTKESMDVVHAHDLDTLIVGVALKWLRGVPLVYDAHEHYAKMVTEDLPPMVTRLLDRLEFILVGHADQVIAANEMIAEYLAPHCRSGPVVVMNSIDRPKKVQVQKEEGKVVIFYGGALEPMRYVLEIMDAIKGLDDVKFKIAGTGSLEDGVRKAAAGRADVELLGYLPKEKVLEQVAAADLVVALLDPVNENNRIGTPNRLFEAMALGTPIIASVGTLSGRMVEQDGCGLSIEWSPENLRGAITKIRDPALRKSMGEKGTAAVERKYNWTIMKERLVAVYAKMTGPSPSKGH